MEVLTAQTEKVQKMYDAFIKGDIPFILKQIDKEGVLEVMGSKEIPYAGIYHGPDDAKRFFEKLNETMDTKELVPDHLLETGNIVIATGQMKGVVRKNNKPVSSIWCHIFEFNDNGKVVHYRDCYDTLAVAKAIGK